MRRTIAIAGAMAQKPGRGGHTWVFLQYVLGFQKLGWDVLFLDRLDSASVQSGNVRYVREIMCRFGLEGCYGLLCDDGTTIGLSRSRILERVAAADALINVMGFLSDAEILATAPRRVFLDIDPGFGQMWHALGLHDVFRGHDDFVTIGERIGAADCAVPTCGLSWITTRQPIVLDQWPAAAARAAAPITTVATWRGAYGPIAYAGETYGLRAHEFRRFAGLPALAARPFEVAMEIDAADARDIELLRSQGWSLVEPREAAGDPWRYRDYIQASAAELMVAKSMYVKSRSGWFSDRSVCYLASGRPVIAQDTGFGDTLPTGTGLLAFSTLEEASEAVKAIDRDAGRHAAAARRLAEEYFDSSVVLSALARRLDLC